MSRPLYTIAAEIKKTWQNVWFGAVPYLDAMHNLDKITEDYGVDSGKDIIICFLANATTWRGENARRIKKELKAMLK